MPKIRGLDKRHEQDPRQLLRDTRTLGQRIKDFLDEPSNTAMIFVCCAVALFFFYAVSDIIFICCLILFIYVLTRHTVLPFRMPKRSKMPDFNDIKPGSDKPNMARGICVFGNDRETNEELWFNNDDMRTHVLIFGSTGSGKTEALVSLAYNSLVQGSGFIYIDGKGDNTLFAKVFSMARSVGREDDVLLINFMTGARDIIGPQERRLSNTLNPFANGSSSMLSQLVVSLMDSASQTPDGDMWKGRAIGFVEALMRVLVYMRDEGKILLDANIIRNYFELEKLEAMTMDKVFVRDGQEPVSLASAPSVIIEPIYNYVVNLPGYNKQKKGKQVSQVLEQHGFITMQLTRVFTSLADTYGHILRTNLAEVDLKDVVLHRRILVVLLPALEKSPAELSNLGKVIIATLKAMMASGLGEQVEGSYREVITRKPTNSPTPFMCIMDEYGYYAVEGFAVVPAQARSLGFCAVFAGQDLPAFQKASKEEALSIGANTNIKIAMKLEDPIETWDFFAKTAGEAFVTKVDSFQTNPQSVFNTYLDARSASSEKRQRIDLMDLKDQREGEAHIFFKSTIIRAKMFYANPSPVPRMRLNHFLKVGAPDIKELIAFEKKLHNFADLIKQGNLKVITPPVNETIMQVAEVYKQEPENKPPIEKGVSALIAIYNKENAGSSEEFAETAAFPTEESVVSAESVADDSMLEMADLNLFNKIKIHDLAKKMVSESEWAMFSAPLLVKSYTQNKIEYILRLLAKTDQFAKNVAKEIVHDMEVSSHYPPVVNNPLPVSEVIRSGNALLESLTKMGQGGGQEFGDVFNNL